MNPATNVRALDNNNDWTFGGGRSNYLTDNAAIGQQIRSRTLEVVGNCFWNPQAGLDWRSLFGQKNLQVFYLAESAIILNTGGVQSLQNLSAVPSVVTRALSMTFKVTTVFSVYTGSLTFSSPVLIGG